MTIPNSLMTAYTDVISHAEESDYLPPSPNDFVVQAHFHALDRACHNDIQYLSRHLSATDIEDEDPDAVEFLRQSLLDAKRLRLWNIEEFNVCELRETGTMTVFPILTVNEGEFPDRQQQEGSNG